MKTVKWISILLGVIFLQACHGDVDKRVYKLENGTNHEVRIELYEFSLFSTTYSSNGVGLIYEGTSIQQEGRREFSAYEALDADSIIVYYDNERFQIYHIDFRADVLSNPPSERNIFSDEDYEVINNNLYRFTFTEEDYENAEEL